MEIRNIYEDYSGEERLYSILMDEDEIALFSALEQRAYAGAWGLNRGVNREPGGVQRRGSFKGVQTPQYVEHPSSSPTQTSTKAPSYIAPSYGESPKALKTSAKAPLRKYASIRGGRFLPTRMGR